MSWNCVVIARRIRLGVHEALVQWECCWVNEDDAMSGQKILEVLLRRTVRGQKQILVHWQCQWIPVEDVDAESLKEYEGPVVVDDLVVPVSQAIAPMKKRKRAKRRNW
jgi:hypothetical protein